MLLLLDPLEGRKGIVGCYEDCERSFALQGIGAELGTYVSFNRRPRLKLPSSADAHIERINTVTGF
jgi:hypothetical protein